MKEIVAVMVILNNSLQHSECGISKNIRCIISILHFLRLFFRDRRHSGYFLDVTICYAGFKRHMGGESVNKRSEISNAREDIVDNAPNIRKIQLNVRDNSCEEANESLIEHQFAHFCGST